MTVVAIKSERSMPECHGLGGGSSHWPSMGRGRQGWPRHQGTGEWEVKSPSPEVGERCDCSNLRFQVPRAYMPHRLI